MDPIPDVNTSSGTDVNNNLTQQPKIYRWRNSEVHLGNLTTLIPKFHSHPRLLENLQNGLECQLSRLFFWGPMKFLCQDNMPNLMLDLHLSRISLVRCHHQMRIQNWMTSHLERIYQTVICLSLSLERRSSSLLEAANTAQNWNSLRNCVRITQWFFVKKITKKKKKLKTKEKTKQEEMQENKKNKRKQKNVKKL